MLGIYRGRFFSSAYRVTQVLTARTLNVPHAQASFATFVPAFGTRQGLCLQNLVRQQRPQHQCQWSRGLARVSAADMTQAKVSERVMTVIKLFEKINADKLTAESHFMKDLGLDSLDHVELIMAVEDEFGFEIPDQDAEKLVKPSDIVKFLCIKLEIAQ